MVKFESPYALGEKVYVGPGRDLVAVVIAVMFATDGPEVKVSYVHNGTVYSTWADPLIITKKED